MTAKPTTIDQYLRGVRPEQRAALNALRRTIHAAAPEAEECITYGLAGFRMHGRALVAFGATRNHCAFFPMSGKIIADHMHKLGALESSKGTIRFQPDRSIPAALVRTLVRARIGEISAMPRKARRQGNASGKRKASG